MIFGELKSATDLCKEITKLAKAARNPELLEKVADLQGIILDLQNDYLGFQQKSADTIESLKTEKAKLESENAELKAKLEAPKEPGGPKLSDAQKDILRHLAEKGSATDREISHAFGIGFGEAGFLLGELDHLELIHRHPFVRMGHEEPPRRFSILQAGRAVVFGK